MENDDQPVDDTPAQTEAVPEGPKLTCNVTISVVEGVLQPLKVGSLVDLTYSQLKDVCQAAVQRVDVEFTNRCKEVNAMVYKPSAQ